MTQVSGISTRARARTTPRTESLKAHAQQYTRSGPPTRQTSDWMFLRMTLRLQTQEQAPTCLNTPGQTDAQDVTAISGVDLMLLYFTEIRMITAVPNCLREAWAKVNASVYQWTATTTPTPGRHTTPRLRPHVGAVATQIVAEIKSQIPWEA